jgi:hypothetical protein
MTDLGIPPFDVRLPFYKYRSIENAARIITSNELYFPNAIELEDEFELHHTLLDLDFTPQLRDRYINRIFRDVNKEPPLVSNIDFHQMQLSIIEDTRKNVGVFSSAKSPNNRYLWGKYGDNFKGVCLGFQVPGNMTKEFLELGLAFMVAYTDNPKLIRLIDENSAMLPKDIFYWLCIKRTVFANEEEIRIVDTNSRGAKKFPKEFLCDIVFGADTTQKDQDLILRLAKEHNYQIQRVGYAGK